jgi:hypothetical protein
MFPRIIVCVCVCVSENVDFTDGKITSTVDKVYDIKNNLIICRLKKKGKVGF